MSLGAAPGDGEVYIDGMGNAGRQLRAGSGVPVARVSDNALGSGLVWAGLAEQSAESGLQPFLPCNPDGGTLRPELTRERFGEPEDTEVIDGMDAAQVLEGWWDDPTEDELAADGELREMLAPFGGRFPSLAPAVEEDLDPELTRRAAVQYTPHSRIGLWCPGAARPTSSRICWAGACNNRMASELAVVLRSWEDRFGARRAGLLPAPRSRDQAGTQGRRSCQLHARTQSTSMTDPAAGGATQCGHIWLSRIRYSG
jgi:hypothetical protein